MLNQTPWKEDRPALIVGILLAAGFSRRFGHEDKLLQPLADQQSMAWHAARHLQSALPHSMAVVRTLPSALSAQLQTLGMGLVACPATATSMADSLVVGVEAAQRSYPQLQGVVIALADMPTIQPATIAQVAQALRDGAKLARPVYTGHAGHPVGFAASLLPALLAVQGDQGARSVVQQHAAALVSIPCEDEGILRDIDTPAQLAALQSGHRLL